MINTCRRIYENRSSEISIGTLYNNKKNNLTHFYWSIGSTKNVKEDRAQTREMGGGLETQFQCG